LNHKKEVLSTEIESGCSRGGTEKKAGFMTLAEMGSGFRGGGSTFSIKDYGYHLLLVKNESVN